MALTLGTGTLGSKTSAITTVPDEYVKLVDEAWNIAKDHPNKFFHVDCGTVAARDEFHAFGKAAAKQHDPVLDYRKLPRPAEKDNGMAYFTLRELTSDTPRPGRKPADK